MKKVLLFSASHALFLGLGFALGIYLLPVLTAPESPEASRLDEVASSARYTAEFKRGLKGNDAFHWGEGKVFIGDRSIAFRGELAPGPDYRLYLVSEFVQDEESFLAVRDSAVMLGEVKTFDAFILTIPDTLELTRYNTVLVWCETFSEFITAAKFR